MLPLVVICGRINTAQDECDAIFRDVAEVLVMESNSREELICDLQPEGRYSDVLGLVRHWNSAGVIGIWDKELIDALPSSAKYIVSLGAGYDKVDVNECKKRGILLANTTKVTDDSTATTALFLAISAIRRFSDAEHSLRTGLWNTRHMQNLDSIHDITGKTIAILGLGEIGFRLAQLAHGFPLRVLYHSRRKVMRAPDWCEYYDAEHLDEMLGQADVLSIHVPLNESTAGMVNEQMIRKLKKGAVLVNTARGRVVDEAAMIRALEDGHLLAVGLDVYPDEPRVNPRLLDFPNATLLPHVGAVTADVQKNIEVKAWSNMRDYIMDGKCDDTVPECR